MAQNGGIIGPVNVTSRGKNTITTKTSSGTITTQPGTRLASALLVGGGGSGGTDGAQKDALRQWYYPNSYQRHGTGGGNFGGGGGGDSGHSGPGLARNGGGGAVRIIWGPGRAFPNTNTINMYDISSSNHSAFTHVGTNNTILSIGSTVKFSLYNVYYNKFLTYIPNSTNAVYDTTTTPQWPLANKYRLRNYSTKTELEAANTKFCWNPNSNTNYANIYIVDTNGNLGDSSNHIAQGVYNGTMKMVKVQGSNDEYYIDAEFGLASSSNPTIAGLMGGYNYSNDLYLGVPYNNITENFNSSTGYYSPTGFQANINELKWKIYLRT